MIHQTNWTGIWEADQTGNLEYDILGNCVILTFPKLIKKADISGNITNTIALPDILRPITFRYSSMRVQINGGLNDAWGAVQIDPDGFIGIGIDANWSAFDTTATAGFYSQSIIYKL